MGRRARTNASPIDSAMEKYHKAIGNRLSGPAMPTLPATTTDDDLYKDFAVLTLDTRQSCRNSSKATLGQLTPAVSARSVRHVPTGMSTSATDVSSLRCSSEMGSRQVAPSEKDLPKEKMRLVNKLTRALFQKKHMCARCKRRSRSCVPNKTFSRHEKHYTCVKCRETSRAIQSHFGGHVSSNDSGRSQSTMTLAHSSSSLLTCQNNDRVIPFQRTNLKDSGYDTVTSCSTVASAYSAFNSSANANSNTNIDNQNVSAKSSHCDGSESRSKRSEKTPNLRDAGAKYISNHLAPCIYSNIDSTTESEAGETAELRQFLGVGQQETPFCVLRQVKRKNIKNYDGYFPKTNYQETDRNVPAPLGDNSDVDEHSENEEFSEIAPRIITVTNPGKTLTPAIKSCYTCESTTKPCFRLPWEGGWICEDCLDGVY